MTRIQFILCDGACVVTYRGIRHQIAPKAVVITMCGATVATARDAILRMHEFRVGDFQGLHADLASQIAVCRGKPFAREEVKCVAVSADAFDVACRLADLDRTVMLRFVYAYCVGVEPAYFCGFLAHVLHSSTEFFEFVNENLYCPWTVTQYAAALGMTPRNLNVLFQEKYGMSAKHWLVERRLQRARDLLCTTSMKVIDVANECGFSNPAHFSDSFRKRFEYCPRTLRAKMSEAIVEEKA
jgi:AraC family transcriptional regulator, exoenzyme S synthesis regulatory protein ExsA